MMANHNGGFYYITSDNLRKCIISPDQAGASILPSHPGSFSIDSAGMRYGLSLANNTGQAISDLVCLYIL